MGLFPRSVAPMSTCSLHLCHLVGMSQLARPLRTSLSEREKEGIQREDAFVGWRGPHLGTWS